MVIEKGKEHRIDNRKVEMEGTSRRIKFWRCKQDSLPRL
jgi:hypothetical protein